MRCAIAAVSVIVLAGCAGQDVASPQPTAQRPQTEAAAPAAPSIQALTEGPLLSPYQLIPGLSDDTLAVDGAALPPAPGATGLMRVGLLVPLTGPSAPIGEALLNAAQIALFDVGDERFVLQVYDTQGIPEGAQVAASLAISQGAQLLLGPLFSAEVAAAAPDAAAAGVNIIAFSTDPTIASARVFVMGFLVDEQVRHIAEHAALQGHLNYAVLAPDSAYGKAVVEAVTRHIPRVGGTVTDISLYDPSGSDLNAIVRELADFDQRQADLEEQKAELEGLEDEESLLALERLELLDTVGDVEFDAILLPEQGVRLTQAAALLPFFDIDPGRVQLLGTMLWNAPGLGREPVMLGGLYPAPPPESTRRFSSRYRDLHGQNPPSIATHGYDAVALAAILAQSGMPAPFSTPAITAASGFAGIDGIFRFTPDGLSQRGFAVLEVTRDGPATASPAPTAFDAALF
jgi:branched-chain amino acid transport system substrate-binding protein